MKPKYSYSASPVFAGLVDYLKMNATTLGGSGYDQGRSGFSLLFFELADFLNDAALEDLASDLLMQVLLYRKDFAIRSCFCWVYRNI